MSLEEIERNGFAPPRTYPNSNAVTFEDYIREIKKHNSMQAWSDTEAKFREGDSVIYYYELLKSFITCRVIRVLKQNILNNRGQGENIYFYNLKSDIVEIEDFIIDKVPEEQLRTEAEYMINPYLPNSIVDTLISKEEPKGLRYNKDKSKWSLADYDALKPMIDVLEFGAKKYSPNNWKGGLSVTDTIESLLRHTYALLKGEDNDSESNLPHTGHILCNAMFLSYMLQFKKEKDDRFIDKNKLSV